MGDHFADVGDEKCQGMSKPGGDVKRECNKITCPAQWVILSKYGAVSIFYFLI